MHQAGWEEPLAPVVKDESKADGAGGQTVRSVTFSRKSSFDSDYDIARGSTEKSSSRDVRPAMLRGGSSEVSDAIHLLQAQTTIADLATRSYHRGLRAKARNLVMHRYFEASIAFIIFLNSVYIGVETEFTMRTGEDDGLRMPWYALDMFFVLIFWAELVLRLYVERFHFFWIGWNLFDFAIVLVATVDKIMVTFSTDSSNVLDIVTVVRILRVARILRIVRLLRFCRELWLIVLGIFSAMRTLFWAWMFIALVCFIGSVFITRTIGHEARGDADVQELYGSMSKTFFTLFQVLTVDDWVDVVNVADQVGWFAKPLFCLFIVITTFAVLNVVVAVIVNKTLENSINHSESQVREMTKNIKKSRDAVNSIFSIGDADGDGTLTRQEFMEALRKQDVMRFLHEVGVDLRRVDQLFDVLDFDESGVLDVDEFVDGVMQARGDARSKDLLELHCDLWRWEQSMRKKVEEFKKEASRSANLLHEEAKSIKDVVGRLKESVGHLL